MPFVFASPGAIAIELGPLQIRWYGILMATAILVGFWLAHRRAIQEGLPADQLVRAAQWAVVAGLAGARLYEVAFNWDYYGRYPGKIIAVWEGGLAMHGGLIVGPLVGAWLAWRWGVPVLRALDVVAPSMILGQAIGRWGNFFNEEAFGAPTDLPWKLYISPPHRPLEFRQVDFFHPTFLYESLWNLLVFALLVALDPAAGAAGIPGRSSSPTSGSTRWAGSRSSRCASTASGSGRSGWDSSRAWRACWWRRRGSAGPCGGRRSRRRRPRPASGYG